MIDPDYPLTWGEFRSQILLQEEVSGKLTMTDVVGGITYRDLLIMPPDQPFSDRTVPVIPEPNDQEDED